MTIRDTISKALGIGGGGLVPGEVITKDGDIEINAGREAIEFDVANSGDRTIMVGSHYHFYEVNDALQFDREQARGYRLDLPAGHASAGTADRLAIVRVTATLTYEQALQQILRSASSLSTAQPVFRELLLNGGEEVWGDDRWNGES